MTQNDFNSTDSPTVCICDEFAFRYNSRTVSDAQRAALLVKAAEGKRLTYRPLAESLDSLTE